MSNFRRFAVYYLPSGDPLAEFGARWLGWDAVNAVESAQRLDGLPQDHVDDVTRTPKNYGFHATLKPPFRLAKNTDQAQLQTFCEAFAEARPPVELHGLHIKPIGSFLAFVPFGDVNALNALAAACVKDFDQFRVPAGSAELERRRAVGLSQSQEKYLQEWGYPYVLDEFRFHLTLTGRLQADELKTVATYLQSIAPRLPSPFVIDKIALVGERDDGRFELVQHYALSG